MAAKLRESDIPDSQLYPGKIKRLALALIRHGSSFEEALAFIASARGISEQDKAATGRWFAENLPKLADRADNKALQEDCACCLGGKRFALAREISKEPTLQARIDRLISSPLIVGYRGQVVDEHTLIIRFFPEMDYYKCSCLRSSEGTQDFDMPASYCWCCGGHLKHHIEKALGCAVEAELITSSLTTHGKEGCAFRIKLLVN